MTAEGGQGGVFIWRATSIAARIGEPKLEFLRGDGKGERIMYFEIELENVLISHIAPSVSAGEIIGESVGQERLKNRQLREQVDGLNKEIVKLASINESLPAELLLQTAIANDKVIGLRTARRN